MAAFNGFGCNSLPHDKFRRKETRFLRLQFNTENKVDSN